MTQRTTQIADNADYTLVAVIIGVHGIKGSVKVKTFTDIPESVFGFSLVNKDGKSVELVKSGVSKGTFIATFNNITNRNDAEDAKGTELFTKRDSFPELTGEEYYHSDLIGMTVVLSDKTPFGTVSAMHNFGAGDLVEVVLKDTNKAEVYHFKNDVVSLDLATNTMVLKLPTYVDTGEDK